MATTTGPVNMGDFQTSAFEEEYAKKLLNYAWPFIGGSSACTVSSYGYFGTTRSSNTDSTGRRWHLGVDLCAKGGQFTPVVAAANGVVTYIGGDPDVRNWQKDGRGWMVMIDHIDDTGSSWYCHMDPRNTVTVGQLVIKGQTVLGYESNTGAVGGKTGVHLHFQINKFQGTQNKCIYGCSHTLSESKAIDPIYILSGGRDKSSNHGGGCGAGNLPIFSQDDDGNVNYYIDISDGIEIDENINLNIGGERLLSPSDDERKYGVSVYDTVQSLIRGATSSAIDGNTKGNVFGALDRYARYLYYTINSAVTVANVQLESMPWIRPGFNIWLDPLFIDRIYYVDSIQHIGGAQSSVYTTLGLTFGRSRKKFQSETHEFGSLKPQDPDNIFVNTMDIRPEHFSKNIVGDAATFESIKTKVAAFYNPKTASSNGFEKAVYHEYLQWFYNTINTECGTVSGAYTSPAIGVESNIVNDVTETATTAETNTITKFDGTYQQGDIILINGRAYQRSSGKGDATQCRNQKGTLATMGAANSPYPYYIKDIGWVAKSSLSFISRTVSTTVTVTRYVSPAATAEYDSVAEIQKWLDAKYAKAPDVVQKRIARHNRIIAAAEKYIAEYYIKEE